MSSAAKVGIFMLVILGILGYFVLKIEDIDFARGGKKREVVAYFDNAAGLDVKSAVRIAGVRKGKVTDIRVEKDGRARVTMEVDDDIPIRSNGSARIVNLGLLGEKYIEIDPGTPPAREMTAEIIEIPGSQTASIDDVTNQVSAIATDVKAITSSLRNVVGAPAGEQRLNAIVENVHAITVQVRDLVAANRSNVDATLANARALSAHLRTEIPRLAASIDRVANSLAGSVQENRSDVRAIVENLRELSSDLRVTADQVNAITGQVKSGEGSVGKLIYSSEAHDRLTNALASVEGGVTELKNTLGRVGRIQLDIGMKGDYYAGMQQSETIENIGGNARGAVTARIRPNPDLNRFYNVELADDPRGSRRDKITEETVIDPVTGQRRTTITKQTRFERDFVVSAQAGWDLGNFAVRLGLFDNTGGGGIDYRLGERLRVTGEAFDFGERRDPNPHVRLFSEYVLRKETRRTPTIFVTTGVDNPLNDTSFLIGGGIRWRDDDLKYLLGSAVGR